MKSIAPKNTPNHLLQCVHLHGGRATTTDGTAFLITGAPEVTTCVNAAKLQQILAESPGATLTAAKDTLTIASDAGTFHLLGYQANDFPFAPSPSGEAVQIIGLRTALDRVVYAASREPSRYAINGVLFAAGNVVATDGHRLSVAEVPGLPDCDIVPLDHLGHITDDVMLTADEDHVFFDCGETRLILTRVSGTFPPWRDVIPKGGDTVTVAASDLAAACRRAAIMTTQETLAVVFDFTPGSVTVSARGAETGDAEIKIPVGGDVTLKIGANPKYLLQALHHLDGDVTLRLSSANKPIVIEQQGFTGVVMPVGV
jgi:DNA polymerase III sliding clamp (beta) subunit (PCNA family)